MPYRVGGFISQPFSRKIGSSRNLKGVFSLGAYEIIIGIKPAHEAVSGLSLSLYGSVKAVRNIYRGCSYGSAVFVGRNCANVIGVGLVIQLKNEASVAAYVSAFLVVGVVAFKVISGEALGCKGIRGGITDGNGGAGGAVKYL